MLRLSESSSIVCVLLTSVLIFLALDLSSYDYSAKGERVVQKTIPVGMHPLSVALNPNTNMIYVTNYQSHSISIINGSQDKLVANISNILYPTDIYVDENSNKIYVNHKARAQDQGKNQYSAMPLVSIIDGSTNRVIGNLSAAMEVRGVNPSRGEIYAIEAPYSKSLVVIDEATNNKKSEVNLNFSPSDIAINQNTNTLYVASNESDSVSKINASTFDIITDAIKLSDIPVSMAVNPSTNRIYFAYLNESSTPSLPNVGSGGLAIPLGSVSVLDGFTDKELTNLPVVSPSALAVDSKTNIIYIANSFSGTVSILDGSNNTIIEEDIKVGSLPQNIAVNSNTDKAYVSNSFSNSITVISNKTSSSNNK